MVNSAGRPFVRQPHEAELGRGPDHQLFGEARQVHGADRRGREEFEREVAVGHRIEAVRRGAVEAERLRRGEAVDGEGGSGKGGSPQRAFVHPRAGVDEARPVAAQHLDIGHHVMAPCHGLRGLQVRKARHDPVGPRFGLRQKGLHQRGQAGNGGIALVADPEAEIDRHLIVARPRGVQAACGFADDLFQPRLDVHVDVFEIGAEGEVSALDL